MSCRKRIATDRFLAGLVAQELEEIRVFAKHITSRINHISSLATNVISVVEGLGYIFYVIYVLLELLYELQYRPMRFLPDSHFGLRFLLLSRVGKSKNVNVGIFQCLYTYRSVVK